MQGSIEFWKNNRDLLGIDCKHPHYELFYYLYSSTDPITDLRAELYDLEVTVV